MSFVSIRGKRGGRGVLFATIGLLLLVILFARVVEGDDLPDLPPQTGSMLDSTTFAQNDAITNQAEQRDQQAMDDVRNGLLGAAPPKDGSWTPPSVVYHDEPLVTGIDEHPVPLAGQSLQYHVLNAWQGQVNGAWVGYLAGSKADDMAGGVWNTPEQGVLVAQGPTTPKTNYLSPTRTGALRITSYSGTCLNLVSTSNVAYSFDMSTRRWSCAPVNNQPPP